MPITRRNSGLQGRFSVGFRYYFEGPGTSLCQKTVLLWTGWFSHILGSLRAKAPHELPGGWGAGGRLPPVGSYDLSYIILFHKLVCPLIPFAPLKGSPKMKRFVRFLFLAERHARFPFWLEGFALQREPAKKHRVRKKTCVEEEGPHSGEASGTTGAKNSKPSSATSAEVHRDQNLVQRKKYFHVLRLLLASHWLVALFQESNGMEGSSRPPGDVEAHDMSAWFPPLSMKELLDKCDDTVMSASAKAELMALLF